MCGVCDNCGPFLSAYPGVTPSGALTYVPNTSPSYCMSYLQSYTIDLKLTSFPNKGADGNQKNIFILLNASHGCHQVQNIFWHHLWIFWIMLILILDINMTFNGIVCIFIHNINYFFKLYLPPNKPQDNKLAEDQALEMYIIGMSHFYMETYNIKHG